MSTTYTRWYRIGSVALTKGSTEVIGTGTYWNTAGLNPGDMFSLDGKSFLEVADITDDTHLTLAEPYTGATQSNLPYKIVRNFTAGTLPKYAASAASIIGDFQKYVDTDLQRITGRSAYEEAVKNGYTGTAEQWLASLSAYGRAVANGFSGSESEWLESLKAAGEWSKLDERTEVLSYGGSMLHNSIARGKCLGTEITDEQWDNIENGSFKDMWIGDYWELPIPEAHKTTEWWQEVLGDDYEEFTSLIKALLWKNGKQDVTNVPFRFVIAGFDYYTANGVFVEQWNTNYAGLGKVQHYMTADEFCKVNDKHHILLIPNGPLYRAGGTTAAQVNNKDIENGYWGSWLNRVGLKPARQIMHDLFGEHLRWGFGPYISTAFSKDIMKVTARTQYDFDIILPSESQVIGFEHNPFDPKQNSSASIDQQLPIFQLGHVPFGMDDQITRTGLTKNWAYREFPNITTRSISTLGRLSSINSGNRMYVPGTHKVLVTPLVAVYKP